MRSLSLGFGAEGRTSELAKKTCREWEIGTYYSAWRVVRDGIVLCGSQDAVDSIDELNVALGRVELGRFVSLRQPSDLDVRIEFDNGIVVDILSTISDEDESFTSSAPKSLPLRFRFAAVGG